MKLIAVILMKIGLTLSLINTVKAGDESEVFVVNSEADVGKPAVMFLLDNSGSMRTDVPGSRIAYTSNHVNGNTGPFNANEIYWRLSSSVPELRNQVGLTNLTNLHCNQAVTRARLNGAFATRAALYKSTGAGQWIEPNKELDGDGATALECSADNAVHGSNSGGGVFASSIAGEQWTNKESDAVDWSQFPHVTFFSGHYLNFNLNPPLATRDRIDIVKDLLVDIIRRHSNIRLGLVAFNRYGDAWRWGGAIYAAATDLENIALKDQLIQNIVSIQPNNHTPLSQTTYEALRYFNGETRVYGFNNGGNGQASNPASMIGETYISPQESCGKNFYILLTDGEPWASGQEFGDINERATFQSIPVFNRVMGRPNCVGSCLDELAAILADEDYAASHGRQPVETSTIGFDLNIPILEETAARGGGGYYLANDFSSLSDAFASIIDNVATSGPMIATPSVAANSFNGISHQNAVYFSLFQPNIGSYWSGNLKKYTTEYDQATGLLSYVDADGKQVIDPTDDSFKSGTTDLLSPNSTSDGENVLAGGASAAMRQFFRFNDINAGASRRIWTDLVAPPNSSHSITTGNQVLISNTALINHLVGTVGVTNTAEAMDLINWVRGNRFTISEKEKSTDELALTHGNGTGSTSRVAQPMGDAINNSVMTISYTRDDAQIGYQPTNQGILHSIKLDDKPISGIDNRRGYEVSGFIPISLWPNIYSSFLNTSGDKVYGIDGEIIARVESKNNLTAKNPIQTAELYFGLRRGGRGWYSMDVTSPGQMALKWRLNPDDEIALATKDKNKLPFQRMGDSWSAPVIGKIRIDDEEQEVVFVAGGYDSLNDDAFAPAQVKGNSIYILDADNGDILWWASSHASNSKGSRKITELKNSITSRITPIDFNGDGYVDQLYFGDLGGVIHGMSIRNGEALSSQFVEHYVIAKLAKSSNESGHRRFYRSVDVVKESDQNGGYIGILAGSGNRNNLQGDENVVDRVYFVKDRKPYQSSSRYDATDILNKDLVNVTHLKDFEPSDVRDEPGWYISLNGREKAISRPGIVNGMAVINTYVPSVSEEVFNADSCSVDTIDIGQGFAYYINFKNAKVPNGLNHPDQDSDKLRRVEISTPGLPSDVVTVLVEDGSGGVVIGDLITGVTLPSTSGNALGHFMSPAYWKELQN